MLHLASDLVNDKVCIYNNLRLKPGIDCIAGMRLHYRGSNGAIAELGVDERYGDFRQLRARSGYAFGRNSVKRLFSKEEIRFKDSEQGNVLAGQRLLGEVAPPQAVNLYCCCRPYSVRGLLVPCGFGQMSQLVRHPRNQRSATLHFEGAHEGNHSHSLLWSRCTEPRRSKVRFDSSATIFPPASVFSWHLPSCALRQLCYELLRLS